MWYRESVFQSLLGRLFIIIYFENSIFLLCFFYSYFFFCMLMERVSICFVFVYYFLSFSKTHCVMYIKGRFARQTT